VKAQFLDLPNLLDHISVALPANIAGLRRDRRERLLQGLYVLARTGFSLAMELRLVTEANLFLAPGNRSVQRVFMNDMQESGLVDFQKQALYRSARVMLLRLSPAGQELCHQLNWSPIQSEWEQLILKHRGEELGTHTAGLLAFCFHARLRDWQVALLPEVDPTIEPDACLTKNDLPPLYVEFEVAPHDKLEKWKKSYQLQGMVALCTFTPALCKQMVKECRQARASVIATDLYTLGKLARNTSIGALWQMYWLNWYDQENSIQNWLAI